MLAVDDERKTRIYRANRAFTQDIGELALLAPLAEMAVAAGVNTGAVDRIGHLLRNLRREARALEELGEQVPRIF